jgi:thioredoxin reductase
MMILPFNKTNTTIYTNGPAPSDEPTQSSLHKALKAGLKLDTRRITRLINTGKEAGGLTIEFETGPAAQVGMLFHRPATRSRAQELIAQLGLEVKANGDVAADEMTLQAAGVRGCFVAGDTCEMVKQAVIAAALGVRAAGGVVHQLVGEEAEAGGEGL